jgi:hypothetical protein
MPLYGDTTQLKPWELFYVTIIIDGGKAMMPHPFTTNVFLGRKHMFKT